jgi:hypothetical protein
MRNDTHRKCLAKNCAFLTYCEIRTAEEGKNRDADIMLSAATCSRFCQRCLASEVVEASKGAGQRSCFMYPEMTEVPLMTPPYALGFSGFSVPGNLSQNILLR